MRRLAVRVGHERAQELTRVAFRRGMVLGWLVVLACSVVFSFVNFR
jgi:hypothetical protein